MTIGDKTIVRILISPSDVWHLIIIGDSKLAPQLSILNNCSIVAWGGTDKLNYNILDNVGHDASHAGYIAGGGQLWFPYVGKGKKFLGVNEPGAGDNCTLSRFGY